MRTRTGLIVVAAILAAAALPAGASPLPASNGRLATTSNDGCPPGSHRDPKGVTAAKEAYAADATATAKAIAAVPCVGSSSPAATTAGDPTAAMSPAAKGAIQRSATAPLADRAAAAKPQ